MTDQTYNVVEKCALGWMGKPFPLPDGTKRLAWETSSQNVEGWYGARIYLCDVTMGNFSKVGAIGFLSVLIPLRTKDALTTRSFKGEANSTDARKEVDEPQLVG